MSALRLGAVPKETTLNGQPAKIEFSTLPTTGIDGTATGYVLSATLNYVQHDLPFYIVAGDGLIILTGIVPAAGENITPEEFAQRTQAAADAAS